MQYAGVGRLKEVLIELSFLKMHKPAFKALYVLSENINYSAKNNYKRARSASEMLSLNVKYQT